MESSRNNLPQHLRPRPDVLQAYATDGDEGANIDRPDAGVLAGVDAHVDPVGSHFVHLFRRQENGIRMAGKSEYRAVSPGTAVLVQQVTARNAGNSLRESAKYCGVPAFGDIHDTFNEGSRHSGVIIFVAKIAPMLRSLLSADCRWLCALVFLLCLLTACQDAPPPTTAAATSGDPAIDELNAAITADPQNADLYAQRATMWYDKKNYDGAIADMQVALSLDSTNIAYHYDLADVYLEYYRSRLALRTLERAARLEPDNVETQLRLAETQLILEQHADAMQSLNEVIRVDPRNPDAYLLLSKAFLETGDTARAIKAAEEVTEIEPDEADAFIMLGRLLFAKGLPRAEQYFDAAVAIDPEDPIALHARADFLRDSERLPEAVAGYRSASIADRQYVAGYFNAGLLLMEQDSFAAARSEFNLVVKNDPVHIRAFFFRGYANELLGDKAAAKSDYEVALRYAPDYELALEGLARVQ